MCKRIGVRDGEQSFSNQKDDLAVQGAGIAPGALEQRGVQLLGQADGEWNGVGHDTMIASFCH
jgi:hypothetical protein